MGRYVAIRLYSMALTLGGLTVLIFLMLRLIPGTVVEQMIGADAIVSPAMVAELTRFFGLDQPWWVQYSRWIGELAQGNLGTSWRTGKPVLALIVERLPVTIELTTLAVGFALVFGIPAGILSATRRDRAVDNVTRLATLLGLSIPVFWQGTMLILFFSIYLRWMPPVVCDRNGVGPRRGESKVARTPESRSTASFARGGALQPEQSEHAGHADTARRGGAGTQGEAGRSRCEPGRDGGQRAERRDCQPPRRSDRAA
jgi:ABC-type dipeptide/oligopeptide/nickel transport system permease component